MDEGIVSLIPAPFYLLLVWIQRNIRGVRSGVSRRDWGSPFWGENGSKAQEMTVSTLTISQGPSQCAGYEVATKWWPKTRGVYGIFIIWKKMLSKLLSGRICETREICELVFTLTSNSEPIIDLFSVVPVCILTLQPALFFNRLLMAPESITLRRSRNNLSTSREACISKRCLGGVGFCESLGSSVPRSLMMSCTFRCTGQVEIKCPGWKRLKSAEMFLLG